MAVRQPKLVQFNQMLATELGMGDQDKASLADLFSGNKIFLGAQPIALAYAGHQFGYFVPQLGDGRAILLGEIAGRDIQLKGSGKTPFSRGGDGRAAIGPMLREYIISEAMHALKIKTTRALALVTTGEIVWRDRPLPGAILTRVAASHVRIGTFAYFAYQQDQSAVKILADYVIDRHYPWVKEMDHPYQALLACVCDSQVTLIVDWMRVGFIHGVMNTDNMTLSGETLDYGPCAFMDAYQADKVFSAIDVNGRYAFNQQGTIGLWNLLQLGYAMLNLLDPHRVTAAEIMQEIFNTFQAKYAKNYLTLLGQKIGLVEAKAEDNVLIQALLTIMQTTQSDYTLTFLYLNYAVTQTSWPFAAYYHPSSALLNWITQWQQRLQQQALAPTTVAAQMFALNPAIIPRNHRLAEVIQAAEVDNDFTGAARLIAALATPYQITDATREYLAAPTPAEQVKRTFCGT